MHGSMILTRDALYQEIGIPRPPGLIPVIPKYRICRDSPWRLRGSSLCRIIASYGPQGLSRAIERLGARQYVDPLYGAPIPYIHDHDVVERVDPLTALERVASKPRGRISQIAVKLAYTFRGWRIGLTGTTAVAAENDEISDIDMIIVTWRPSGFLEEFTSTVKPYTRNPALSWRRGYYNGVHTSWVAVPPDPAGHCPPLSNYWSIDTPHKLVSIEVRVDPGQEEALLYPPCVQAGDIYVISYEYNDGIILYRGGRIRVRGVAGEYTVYTGVREAS